MKILRVFNNNLVLALDESGREVILTGRGLGFQARPGQEALDAAKVSRVFVPADGGDSIPGQAARRHSTRTHPVGQPSNLATVGLDSRWDAIRRW